MYTHTHTHTHTHDVDRVYRMNMATFPPIDEKASKLMKMVRCMRVSLAHADAFMRSWSSVLHLARPLLLFLLPHILIHPQLCVYRIRI